MSSSMIITALILFYVVWVIRRKIKDYKEGHYCSCGCDECSRSCSVKKEK